MGGLTVNETKSIQKMIPLYIFLHQKVKKNQDIMKNVSFGTP